jgi:hypothetical protein
MIHTLDSVEAVINTRSPLRARVTAAALQTWRTMARMFRALSALCLSAVVLGLVAPVRIQAQAAQTPSQFYLNYRKAFEAAKKIEDLLPYMGANMRQQVEATPAKDRAEMFGMIKMMDSNTGIKVVKETTTPGGATLAVQATDSETKKMKSGEIMLVREGTAWKLDRESWN